MNLLLLLSIAASVCLSAFGFCPFNIRVFPAVDHIAGVFQVSCVNYVNVAYYAFNASEARRTFVVFFSETILLLYLKCKRPDRGLKMRFGWTDENLAVIPRITAQENCGQNQTGLVKWRAKLEKAFDVFCFNESAALVDPTTFPTQSTSSSSLPTPVPSQSIFTHTESVAEKALRVGSAQGSSGKKAVAITSVVAVFLALIAAVVYIKLKCNSDKEPRI
ncbi:unnamed protein product [Knipowitschia caucasica]